MFHTAFIATLATLFIGALGIDFEVNFTPGSLSQSGWVNQGTKANTDITSFTGTVRTDVPGATTAMCWSSSQSATTFIDYNTNSALVPELTMIAWIRPEDGYTPTGKDWLLGHDNGGFDRSIIVYDSRYNGIAAGIGYSYASSVTYPTAGQWTQVAVTFSKSSGVVTVYKNGGAQSQTKAQGANSGGFHYIGLNGLIVHSNHNFVGCIGKVQIINQVLSAAEVADLYSKGLECGDVGLDSSPAHSCQCQSECGGSYCNSFGYVSEKLLSGVSGEGLCSDRDPTGQCCCSCANCDNPVTV